MTSALAIRVFHGTFSQTVLVLDYFIDCKNAAGSHQPDKSDSDPIARQRQLGER
jgi:hypothetical protein